MKTKIIIGILILSLLLVGCTEVNPFVTKAKEGIDELHNGNITLTSERGWTTIFHIEDNKIIGYTELPSCKGTCIACIDKND